MSESERPAESAREFIIFCDGLEQGGMVAYAQRGRNIARELLATLAALSATTGALVAVTEDRDRFRDDRWRERHGTNFPR